MQRITNRAIGLCLSVCVGWTSGALAEPITADPLIFSANWINVVAGPSRFNATGIEYSELTVGAYPSPDSDATGQFGLPQSDNGAATIVEGSHPYITNGDFISLEHVGPVSGSYGWGTYVTYAESVAAIGQDDIDSFTAGWTLRMQNPAAPSGTIATATSNELNPDARPELVTDARISGAGLNPTITWENHPDTDHVSVSLFRVLDDATNLVRNVHNQEIPNAGNSFVIPSEFSGAALIDPTDHSLRLGEHYLVLIANRALSSEGLPEGAARTWFEFTAVEDNGQGEAAIYIPTVTIDPETGQKDFSFDIEVTEGEEILIDPEVAVGYTYETGQGDPDFATVRLPTLPGADQFYDLILFDEHDNPFDTLIDIVAGELFDFRTALAHLGGQDGIAKFRILGIEPTAFVDPSDVQGFVTGLTFVSSGRFTGTQTPITAFVQVPEPESLALLLAGLLAFAARRTTTKTS